MTTNTEVQTLCKAALEEESSWREGGADARKNAYDRFQRLVHEIADLTGRTYEDVMNDAVEEWVTVHFCSTSAEHEPSAEWEAAAHAEG
jgi:hypothetical protein